LIPGNQLGHCEGLCQIVVRSCVESCNPVLNRVARRQDQDRQAFSSLPRGRQNGEPVTIGQAQVEDGGVIVDKLECGAGIGARGGNIDGETDGAEFGLQDAGKAVFILDDQKTQR
jgi:hypothetical protein